MDHLQIKVEMLSMISYVLQYNNIPIISRVVIQNDGPQAYDSLILKINSECDAIVPYESEMISLKEKSGYQMNHLPLKLDYAKLIAYTESIKANIHFSLTQGDVVLKEEIVSVDILPSDYWMGYHVMPELLCSFVTPNQPLVSELIVKASEELNKIHGSAVFSGYMSQSENIVMAQIQALYQAVWKHHVIYVPSKASYECYGQRIRMPKEVIRMNSGNCVEMACLFASLMEAIHLHPVIVLRQGHAYVGCWTKEETFSECVVDDIATVEKYTASGIYDIVLFECTMSNQETFVPFEQAMAEGQAQLKDDFIMLIDVKRSRGSGIRPFNEIKEQTSSDAILTARDQEVQDTQVSLDIKQYLSNPVKTQFTRIQAWERKLLDMSLRNPLISARLNRNALQLMVCDLDKIEDALDGGKEFQILPAPEDLTLLQEENVLQYTTKDYALYTTLMQSEFKSKRFRSFMNAQKTEDILRNLYRASRLSIEENGTNTLYLALGFLKWYENDISEKARYAPLLLLPVEIVRKTLKTGYVIRERDEDILFNETLLEMLKQDFKLEIQGLDSLPLDENGVDVNLVFNLVRQAIKSQKRWNVVELALLGLFSFKQFVMWNDLRNRSDELANNKVVKSLMDGQMSWPYEDLLDGVDFDKDYKPIDMALPMDIDSSQLSAVALADKGQSFILHGPPGTGKSQTITNMIANALYHNKSVLFIAEKSAALNVVRKRLEKIGLGPFCLELHSDKARKRDVLSQLDATMELGQLQYPQTYEQKADELYQLRMKLSQLMEDIHKPSKFGQSLYEYMNRIEELKDIQDVKLFSYQNLATLNDARLQEKQKALHDYAVSAQQIDALNHALLPIDVYQYSLEIKELLAQQSNQILDGLSKLQNDEALYSILDACQSEDEAQRMIYAIRAYLESAYCDPALFDVESLNKYEHVINEWIPLHEEAANLQQELSKLFKLDRTIPYDQIEKAYREASESFFLFRGMNEKKVAKELSSYASQAIEKDKVLYYCDQLREYDTKHQKAEQLMNQFSSVYGRWMKDTAQLAAFVNEQKKLKEAYRNCPCRDEVKQYVLNATTSSKDVLVEVMNVIEQQKAYVGYRKKDRYFTSIMRLNVLLQMHGERLREFVLYSQSREQVEKLGLKPLVDGYEQGIYPLSELDAMLEKAYLMLIVEYLMSDKVNVMKFTYASMMDTLTSYRQATTDFQQLTKEELAARLSSRIPTILNLSSTSEIAILKRAIKSNGRAMSIRKLFDQIPNLLRRLTPCMLMSPMSVAQYIDPKYPKFDLVIFDEASQLPTSSAVGAIARGENLIVVGDPKQMPPTSFFQANNVDEENLEKEDLESILDDCLSLSMPQLYLSWHYRSEHESLIAFSNMQFYENRLMTFPSVENQKSMIKFVQVNGNYRKGKNRVNKEEAQAIVAEIRERLFDEKRCNQSIGVVTFNITQQILIDDLLMEALREDKEFEERANALYEPIFIKNLENVQGDERDVILFSICYGPDEDGKVSMNFGPINRDGGERRLNVAVSRSRKEMVVFSTLLPHQIDLNRTRSRGAAELKAFLEYAMKGNINQNQSQVQDVKDTYVEKIAESLREAGYDVDTFVGSSRFKVDIAIKDPQQPENYLVGVMVDGLQYASAITTRDRSISQISVLKRLGWNVFELFILDWWEHKEDVLKRLNDYMLEIQQPKEEIIEAPKKEVFEFKKAETPVVEKTYPIYEKVSLSKCRGGAEAAALSESQSYIISQMEQVLEKEAPIAEDLLFARINEAWDISRLGPRLRNAYTACAEKLAEKGHVSQSPCTKKVFYWGQINPDEYTDFRVPSEDYRRALDEIAYQELMNAAKEVLTLQFSMSTDDLKREIAKMFGWQKVTSATTDILDHVVQMMIKKEIAMMNDQKVQLKA